MSIGTSKNLSQLSYEDLSFSESISQTNLVAAEPSGNYDSAIAPQQWVQVLVDCPKIQGLYTYSIPPALAVQAGDVVNVPFRTQVTRGIAIDLMTSPPDNLSPSRIRPVEDVITSGFFPDSYWQLLVKIANYYCTDLISAIRVALPPGLLGRSQRRVRLNS